MLGDDPSAAEERDEILIKGSGATPIVTGETETPFFYEQGTWTPTQSNITLDAADGHYIVMGKLVLATFFIDMPVTSSSGNAGFSGLPYAAVNSADNIYYPGFLNAFGKNMILKPEVLQGNKTFNIIDQASGSTISLSDISDTILRGTLIYRKA